MSKKICIVAGARPNFIKVAPVIRAIENARKQGEDVEYELVFTGRENDETLEDSLFSDLDIRKPDVYLGVDCENMNELTGQVMAQFERYLQQHPTDVVIVVDDLASTMAVAIVTKKQGVKLSDKLDSMTGYCNSGEINFKLEDKKAAMDAVRDHFTSQEEAQKIMDFDGYRVEFKDWWFNIRPSNTEPYLRFSCEARSEELLKKKIAETEELLVSKFGALRS